MRQSGAQALISSLVREGVEVVFGYPGGAVLPIYDVLYDSQIKHILVRHEQGAAHAADGYARATGRAGVCLATSGPGATNLVTGLATAYMDSVPMVALTGQVASAAIGKDSFQEADITGITLPITKHSYLVTKAQEIPRVIKEAFHIATTGRPGPVLVDLTKDALASLIEGEPSLEMRLPGYKPNTRGHVRQIRQAAAAIRQAKKPLLYVGGGAVISGAHELLVEMAQREQIPVVSTLLGLGAFPSAHPLFLGMLGMHGTVAANYAVTETDLLIAVGARFDDRVTGRLDAFAPEATIIHIDIDPAEIGKNVAVDIPIVGDLKLVLEDMLEVLEPGETQEWVERCQSWCKTYPQTYQKKEGVIKPQSVVEAIHKATGGEAIICTEVGQNQMWSAQHYTFKSPRSFISSGGLGTMGYGLPASMGAKVACPERPVFNIAGDGSIQMNIQELATCVYYKIPVKVAILNNGFLGMVRQWQEIFYSKRYSSTVMDGNPDFVKLAEAYGALGLRIVRPEDVDGAIAQALAYDGPVVMDFRVCPEENVIPMVPPGGALNQMIGGGSQ